MKQQLVRDNLGKIQGLVSDYWNSEDEVWEDVKCKDVRFPNHNQYAESPVTVYHISQLNKK